MLENRPEEGYESLKDVQLALDEEIETYITNSMVEQLVIRSSNLSGEHWSISLKFSDININELNSLTIAIYNGELKLGEQEATSKTLELEQTNLSSPFYLDQREDEEYWTKNMNLLSGTPDKVVVTFEYDGEIYTVESTDSNL